MEKIELSQISQNNERGNIVSSLCQRDKIEISISYISDFKNAKILREFTDELCKHYGVHPRWRTRIVLIIDELNNNAIEYGSNPGDLNHLHLSLCKEEGENIVVQASVTDTGKGSHAKHAKDMEDIRKKHESKDFTKHVSIRGRGLFLIISRLVDTLYFDDAPTGGLVVGIHKTIKGS